jgi:hypothetical protein
VGYGEAWIYVQVLISLREQDMIDMGTRIKWKERLLSLSTRRKIYHIVVGVLKNEVLLLIYIL